MNERRPSRSYVLLSLALCLLITGCTTPNEPDGTVNASPSLIAPGTGPLQARTTASDGGTAQVTETGATTYPPTHREYTAGVAVTNTSTTDLLVRVDIRHAVTDKEGYDRSTVHYTGTVLPGQTTYTGYRGAVGEGFVSGGAAVAAAYWIPMTELAARGMDAGLTDITGSFGDVNERGDRMAVKVSFTSHFTNVADQKLRVLVVFRDPNGKLLGAMPGIRDFPAAPAGPHESDDELFTADWPPGADKSTSTVTMTVDCCAIIPTPEGIPPWRD